MAKVKMQKLRITAMTSDRKAVLEELQHLECVQADPAAADGEIFSNLDTGQQQERFEGAIQSLNTALSIIDRYVPEKSGLLDSYRPRPEISREDYEYVLESNARNLNRCGEIIAQQRQIDELGAEIVRLRMRIDALKPWLGGDVPMRYSGTSSTAMMTGYFPEPLDNGELLKRLAQTAPELDAVHFEIVGAQPDMTCVYVFCIREQKELVEGALRTMGFTRPAEMSKKTPAQCSRELQERIDGKLEQITALENRIKERAARRKKFRYLLGYYEARLDKYKTIEKLASSKNVFCLEGWTPAKQYGKVEKALSKYGAYCEKLETEAKDDPPVALKSNFFTEGGAPVTEMFALPSKSDIDPTAIMSFFYYLLFGIMLGDAAYGIIMALATAFVMIKYRPEAEKRRTMKLFFYSGLSSIFWGVLFGSWFGDLPNVVAKTFFGYTENVVNPILFDPISEPMLMLYLSIGLGALHIFTGLFMGIVTAAKNRDAAAAIFDYLAWLTMLLAGVGWALLSLIKMPFEVPENLPKILLWVTVGSAAAILLMNGRSSKNFFVRIAKGAYALYGVTGYMSDVMSYSRILALGLATGVISQVFNQMGAMVGSSGGVVGIILMTVVCLIGHGFNIGISLIGCYVHTCRLQFVEFFGKFYEGGGRAFTPLEANTKFYRFKEDN